MTARHFLPALIALLLAAQVAVFVAGRGVGPQGAEAVPGVAPTPTAAKALAFGDDQFLHRVFALRLTTAGDWDGRVVPLRAMHYGNVVAWLRATEALDPRANLVPALAMHYFGQSQDPAQVAQVVGFLRGHGIHDPDRKWRWLAHAVFLARHRANDLPLALELAQELAALPSTVMPVWARQMPAFVLDAMGEREAADLVMGAILATESDLSPAETAFMLRFLDGQDGLRP
jgi:hypothetical protein